MKKKIIGYQIVSRDSECDIPEEFYSFEVIKYLGEAVRWIEMEAKNPKHGEFRWTIVPVYEGDIEEPTIIDFINVLGRKHISEIEGKKVAKIVTCSFMARVIVNENASDEEIIKKARGQIIETVKNDLGENIEEIMDDTESPFDPEYDL